LRRSINISDEYKERRKKEEQNIAQDKRKNCRRKNVKKTGKA
jgi:hypothetical protein